MDFICNDKSEEWVGKIINLKNLPNYYEFKIESRSSIYAVIGKMSRGNFACFPDFNVGCHLSSLNDLFWNSEKLTEILGVADGLTVAYALKYIHENLKLQM